ncbi:hypothetical protein ACTFIW_005465 [Dictyostelium discoideum]
MHYNGPSVCKTKAVLLRRYNDTSYSHCKYSSFIKFRSTLSRRCDRWKSNDTVDTFYDKRIIGEKSGGFLNTFVQIS